jgi:hypothetical protein
LAAPVSASITLNGIERSVGGAAAWGSLEYQDGIVSGPGPRQFFEVERSAYSAIDTQYVRLSLVNFLEGEAPAFSGDAPDQTWSWTRAGSDSGAFRFELAGAQYYASGIVQATSVRVFLPEAQAIPWLGASLVALIGLRRSRGARSAPIHVD